MLLQEKKKQGGGGYMCVCERGGIVGGWPKISAMTKDLIPVRGHCGSKVRTARTRVPLLSIVIWTWGASQRPRSSNDSSSGWPSRQQRTSLRLSLSVSMPRLHEGNSSEMWGNKCTACIIAHNIPRWEDLPGRLSCTVISCQWMAQLT